MGTSEKLHAPFLTTFLYKLQVDGMLILDLLVDSLFMADVVLHFHTGYVEDQVQDALRRKFNFIQSMLSAIS